MYAWTQQELLKKLRRFFRTTSLQDMIAILSVDHELSEEDKLKVTRAGDREIPLIPFQVG